METIESTLEQITSLLNQVYGLPSALFVIIGCIIGGYLLRFWKKFPNDGIPVAVTFLGAILFPIIADLNNAMPWRTWFIRNVIFGLALGFAAWVVHNWAISKIEAKLKLFLGGTVIDPNDKPIV